VKYNINVVRRDGLVLVSGVAVFQNRWDFPFPCITNLTTVVVSTWKLVWFCFRLEPLY